MSNVKGLGGRVSGPPALTGVNGRHEVVPSYAESASELVYRPSAPQNAGINPSDLWSAFRRRWFLCLSVGLLLGVLGSAAAWMLVPAPFRAHSEINVSSVNNRLVFDTAEERSRFEVFKQTQMKAAGRQFVLSKALNSCEDDVARLRGGVRDHMLSWLEDHLQVNSSGMEFFEIALEGDDAVATSNVVNAIANAYLDEEVEDKKTERRTRINQLEAQENSHEETRRRKRNTLEQLTAKLNAGNVTQADTNKEAIRELQIELRKQLSEVQSRIIQTRSDLAVAQQLIPAEAEGPAEITEFMIQELLLQDGNYRALQLKLSELKAVMGRERSRYGPDHPIIRDMQTELKLANEELKILEETLRPLIEDRLRRMATGEKQVDPLLRDVTRLQAELGSLETQQSTLQTELAALDQQDKNTGEFTDDLEDIQKEIEKVDEVIDKIRAEITKSEVELEAASGIRIYRKAEVPYTRNFRKRFAGLGIAGMGLPLAWMSLVIAFEYRKRRMHSSRLLNELQLEMLGQVPFVPLNYRQRAGAKNGKSVDGKWNQNYTEAIHSVRNVLIRRAEKTGTKSVVVMSAVSGEGKTSLATHLARSLAASGYRTLLIDGDIRKSNIHRIFGIQQSPGLAEIIMGDSGLKEALQEDPLSQLSVVAAGHFNQEVAHALTQNRVRDVLEEAYTMFDFVIMDSSPILPVSDGLSLACHAHGVIVSVHRDVSRMAMVKSAVDTLRKLDTPIIGAVAIGLYDDYRSGNYSYYDNYYYYGRGDSKSAAAKS